MPAVRPPPVAMSTGVRLRCALAAARCFWAVGHRPWRPTRLTTTVARTAVETAMVGRFVSPRTRSAMTSTAPTQPRSWMASVTGLIVANGSVAFGASGQRAPVRGSGSCRPPRRTKDLDPVQASARRAHRVEPRRRAGAHDLALERGVEDDRTDGGRRAGRIVARAGPEAAAGSQDLDARDPTAQPQRRELHELAGIALAPLRLRDDPAVDADRDLPADRTAPEHVGAGPGDREALRPAPRRAREQVVAAAAPQRRRRL